MPFTIVRDNIVHMSTDAIVNAANAQLAPGGGVCGSIFESAGFDDMLKACRSIGHCDIGGAVITDGFALKARYVIHAVGPVWQDGHSGEQAMLCSAYQSALALAQEHGLQSIAFPLISSGIFGYPKDRALDVAVDAIGDFLREHDMDVYLVVYDRAAYQLSSELFHEIQSYIGDHYVDERDRRLRYDNRGRGWLSNSLRNEYDSDGDFDASFSQYSETLTDGCVLGRAKPESDAPGSDDEPLYPGATAPEDKPSQGMPAPKLDSAMGNILAEFHSLNKRVFQLQRTFSERVLELIDERGLSDVAVYKRANLDRKLFSKLRSDREYRPSKRTAVALCVALELTLEQTDDLLRRAGYALSPSSRMDVIVRYFIEKGSYDIFKINEALFAFEESSLGV